MKLYRKKIFAICLFSLLLFILSGCKEKKITQEVFYEFNEDYADLSIPGYYDSYLLNKKDLIISRENIASSFYFLTDLHWEVNSKKSPALVNYLVETTGINKAIFGGDYLSYDYMDVSISYNIFNNCIYSFKNVDKVAIIGNHESNVYTQKGTPKIDDITAFNIINRKKSQFPYFYEKDNENNLCYLYLNSSIEKMDEDQVAFIKECLSALDSSWYVVIFIHIFNQYALAGQNNEIASCGTQLDEVLYNLNLKCNIVGIFSGHIHRDSIFTSQHGYNVITTMCDSIGSYAMWDNTYHREENSISEQAFDVVQIDLAARKCYLVRIGCGEDREFIF